MAFIQPSAQPNTPAWDPNFQYDTSLQGIKMRQALAQQITNDQLPTQTQVINGFAVKQGAATPLANATNRILGMYLQGKNIDDLHGLGAQSNANLAHAMSEDTTTTPDDQYIHARPQDIGPIDDTVAQPTDQSAAESARLTRQDAVPSQGVPPKVLAQAVSTLKDNPQAAVAAATAVQKTKAQAIGIDPAAAGFNPGADSQAANTPTQPAINPAINPDDPLGDTGSFSDLGRKVWGGVKHLYGFNGDANSAPQAGAPTSPPAQPAPASAPVSPQALAAAVSPPPAAPTAPSTVMNPPAQPAPQPQAAPQPAAPVAQPAPQLAPQPAQPSPFAPQAVQALQQGRGVLQGDGNTVQLPGVPQQDQAKVQQQIIDLANSGPMGQQYATAMMQKMFQTPDWKMGENGVMYNAKAIDPRATLINTGTGGKVGIEQDRMLSDVAAKVDPKNVEQVASFQRLVKAQGKDPANYPIGPSAPQAADAAKGNAVIAKDKADAQIKIGELGMFKSDVEKLRTYSSKPFSVSDRADYEATKSRMQLAASKLSQEGGGDPAQRLAVQEMVQTLGSLPSYLELHAPGLGYDKALRNSADQFGAVADKRLEALHSQFDSLDANTPSVQVPGRGQTIKDNPYVPKAQ